MLYKGNIDETLLLSEITSENCFLLKERLDSGLMIFWTKDEETHLKIDGIDVFLQPYQVIFLTEFHKICVEKIGTANLVKFNRPFYCISDHDHEVGCKGILFFGASQLPIISIPPEEVEKFDILWKMFQLEMESKDNLQIEMLQMMLKRLIIMCTRIYKEQTQIEHDENGEYDIVREFNYLVEAHFRKLHKVSDYAELLFKSPKTLSNLFAKYHDKTPLQMIKDRKMLEARRLLGYTQKAVSEIAQEIGYDDVQSFSRFFKSQQKVSPKEYRENLV